MNKRRVVITGMGTLTPFGAGVDVLWNNIVKGNSAIKTLKSIDTELSSVKIGGEIPEFDTTNLGSEKEVKRYSKPVLYAVATATEAMKDSGLDLENEDLTRIGVVIGSGAGGIEVIQNAIQSQLFAKRKTSPFTIPMMISNMPAGIVAIKFGLKGVNKCVTTACATGTHAIGDAFRLIQYGEADVILAGGTEAAICDFAVSGFNCAKTLSKHNEEPEKASRPYDKARDGFVMSDGSATLVVEELEHAKKRGAKIYAEILGYGQNCDAYDMVAPNPDGEGAMAVMKLALEDAKLNKEDISYINAHGTSTHVGDIAESKAIVKLFGDKETNKNLLVSSTKSMLGHSLGATGAVEAVISIKSLINNIVPPTINLENQDEDVANLDYVPNVAREHKTDKVMSNSFGFGGCNAVLIFGRCKD